MHRFSLTALLVSAFLVVSCAEIDPNANIVPTSGDRIFVANVPLHLDLRAELEAQGLDAQNNCLKIFKIQGIEKLEFYASACHTAVAEDRRYSLDLHRSQSTVLIYKDGLSGGLVGNIAILSVANQPAYQATSLCSNAFENVCDVKFTPTGKYLSVDWE